MVPGKITNLRVGIMINASVGMEGIAVTPTVDIAAPDAVVGVVSVELNAAPYSTCAGAVLSSRRVTPLVQGLDHLPAS